MMLLDKSTGKVEHRRFDEIVSFLSPGDCVVINDSRVIPARLRGISMRTGRPVEFLLHEQLDENHWEVLVKPVKKINEGDRIIFADGLLSAEVKKTTSDGLRVVFFEFDGIFNELLERFGETPLPKYIRRGVESDEDRARYQTVYALHDGSVAAPTAGLHFNEEILKKIAEAEIKIARVTLHVGLGTFRPVKAENIDDHKMHHEFYNIAPDQAKIINEAKSNGKRVLAVGTTSCRTLECGAGINGTVSAGSGRTDLFIRPGYEFKIVGGLLTNFHLPESTLIMLVSALAGRENVLAAYQSAIENEYRFYSYGDCMLVL